MQTRIKKHIRSNVVGYVAVFLATTGTAVALPGKNTVDSGDIINGEVKKPDVGSNAVTTDKIRNGHVRGADILDGGIGLADLATDSVNSGKVTDGSLTGADIADGSLFGADVGANSLTGAQISEPTLSRVPESTSSLLGGTGRSSGSTELFSCDPESTTLIVCDTVSLTLAAPSRVLVIGQITAIDELFADVGVGTCELGTSVVDLPATSVLLHVGAEGDADFRTDDATMVGVTPVLGPGNVEFRIRCNQGSQGAINYARSEIAAVALSPN